MNMSIVIGDPPVQNGLLVVTVDTDVPYAEVDFPQVGDPGTPTPGVRVSPLVTVGALVGIAQAVAGAAGIKTPS